MIISSKVRAAALMASSQKARPASVRKTCLERASSSHGLVWMKPRFSSTWIEWLMVALDRFMALARLSGVTPSPVRTRCSTMPKWDG